MPDLIADSSLLVKRYKHNVRGPVENLPISIENAFSLTYINRPLEGLPSELCNASWVRKTKTRSSADATNQRDAFWRSVEVPFDMNV